jgi:hypothetical protein
MAFVNICSKSASKLLRDASIPYSPFIRNEAQPSVEPEADPEVMMLAALEAAVKFVASDGRASERLLRKRFLVALGSSDCLPFWQLFYFPARIS